VTELGEWLEADVLGLGMQADEARRARPAGGIVTYLRVHEVTAADLAQSVPVPEAAAEVRLYDTPDSFEEALAQIRALSRTAAPRRAVAYSLAEVEQRAAAGWGSLPDILQKMAAAGLANFAEVPVDRLTELARSLRGAMAAGIGITRLTVSHPLGERKLELLQKVRGTLEQHASPIRFAPLPRVAPVEKPTTGYEDVRMVALSRVAFGDGRMLGQVSIEVDWRQYGPKLAQVALTFGADHLDAVPATSDPALGPRRATVEDVERNIRAAGFEPQEYHP
jgi:hypothetical protein